MMVSGYCNTESIPAVSEGEHLTLDDLRSRGISLCRRDQYERKDLIWQRETGDRAWAAAWRSEVEYKLDRDKREEQEVQREKEGRKREDKAWERLDKKRGDERWAEQTENCLLCQAAFTHSFDPPRSYVTCWWLDEVSPSLIFLKRVQKQSSCFISSCGRGSSRDNKVGNSWFVQLLRST